MNAIRRIKGAARMLLRGDASRRARKPIPEITAPEVQEIKRFFRRDKFFIFGHARSGTTLLMRLVRLHPEVHCSYQAHFFTRRPLLKALVDTPEIEEWLDRKSNRWNHGRDLSPIVLRAAAEFIMEREADAEHKRIVGDKSPSSTIHGQSVRDLHAVFPEAKLVYLVRDGRDVLVSERLRNFVEESRHLQPADRRILENMRTRPESFANGARSIFTDAMVRRVAGGWSANVGEIETEGRRLFGARFISLRYEDLLAEPFEQMAELWKFLGVTRIAKSLRGSLKTEMRSNPDEAWQASRNADLTAWLAKGRPGGWRSLFTTSDKSAFKEVAGDSLIRWKYETSLDW